MKFIERSLEPVIKKALREFPVVTLTGPRQSGKTTLLRERFSHRYRYVSLEAPDVRAAASNDPRGFLDANPPPVIFDEIQHVPDLLPYIKEQVDADRMRYGQYLLTGSQNLLLLGAVKESLAGRVAMLRLLPLSFREEDGDPRRKLPWEGVRRGTGKTTRSAVAGSAGPSRLWRRLLRGSYPVLVRRRARDLILWHGSYIETYLERDVRALRQVGDLTQFQVFLRALAARSAQLLNLSSIARDIGVSVNTAKAWLSVLEATYQIVLLRPYHANLRKRLVKSPKVYFTDVGTLCYLVGLKDPGHAAAGPLGGAILETAVLAEIFKTLLHSGQEPRLYFWRTATGVEVDFLVESEGRLHPVEVKSSATPRPAMAAGIHALRQDLGDRISPGYVVHPGHTRLPLGGGVTALPITEL